MPVVESRPRRRIKFRLILLPFPQKYTNFSGSDVDMEPSRILAQFKSETGDPAGAPFDLPLDITTDQLQLICKAVLHQDDHATYSFFVEDREITESLKSTLQGIDLNTEKVLDIIYQPQAIFRVRAVTRCTSTLSGHAEAVISVAFSPDGR